MTNYSSPNTIFKAKREDFEQKKFNVNGQISGTGNGPYDKNIYDLEKNLINAINDFYIAYADYVRCGPNNEGDGLADTQYNSSNYHNDNKIKTPSCTDTLSKYSSQNPSITLNKSYVDGKQEIVKNKANALTLALGNVTSLNRTDYSNTMNIFNRGHQTLLNNYSNNLNLRNELDLKMKEILKTDDSFVNQSKLHYDSTMYASIGWTILATSLLYYVFRKL